MTEQSFTTEVIQWAKTYKWRVHHIRNSGFGGNTYIQGDKGFPDLVMAKPPRLIFAELKLDKKPIRPEQQAWLDDLAANSEDVYGMPSSAVKVYVWRPSQWSEILKVLSAR